MTIKLIPTNDAIIVLDEGFSAIVPPELRAQRTVICFNLDDFVYENSPEDIAAEVGAQHTWTEAETVFKFPRTSTINQDYLPKLGHG